MNGSKSPRYILFALLLGISVTAIMLSMFYGQYRWLAGELVQRSAAEHDAFIEQNYERRVSTQMRVIAESFSTGVNTSESADVLRALNSIIAANPTMSGIRFTDSARSTLQTGSFPIAGVVDSVTWLADDLVVVQEVIVDGAVAGKLAGAFELESLRAEEGAFASQLTTTEQELRRASYLWIGIGTLAVVIVCGIVVWLIARDHTLRIRELKRQAEKLRDADFGEQLPETRDDELGELASVFNAMRDRLQETTIRRDYVDSILSSMNDAIIVASNDGKIKRINKATSHLLGYEESELIDTSIDYIVNTKKSGSLLDEAPSGLPREVFFESKFGESIPVSFTCSIIDDDDSGDRVYAAQNITERRRAEQRIRYLARIDALTKIPNRMQFQHLLQRAIARARRSGQTLCLFYIDIDSFKEINDTFGHLAGDTTLETVAERLSAGLPRKSVIGRLAGDEFAVIVDGADPGAKGRDDCRRTRAPIARQACRALLRARP